MRIVLFDFDGTLTVRDTLRPFAGYMARCQRKRSKLAIFYLHFLMFKLRISDEKRLKETFLRIFVEKIDVDGVRGLVNLFYRDMLDSLLNDVVYTKLRKHVDDGDRVYLVSANFDFLLEPLVDAWGLSGIVATETERENGRYTGRIAGNTCKGRRKVEKLISIFGADEVKKAVAYGDEEDEALLGSVGYGIRTA